MEIPEGWRKTSLGALVKHTKGFAFKSKNYKSSGVRIIRISDTSGLNIKVGNEIYCSEKEAKSLDSYQLEVDDIIVNTVGSRPHLRESMVGRVIRITKDEAGSLLNQNMVRLKPNSAIDSDFLFYNISNEHFLDFVSRIVRGNANQVSITLKDLFTFPASLPPLPEQKRIAKIIGTWNQAIAVTEALIDQSEAQKKALMQQLLTGKRRLPGFEGEWREVRLDAIFQFKKGQGISKKAVVKDGVFPCVLYGELYTHYGDVIRAVKSATNSNEGIPSAVGDVLIPASTTTTGIDLANATAVLEDGIRLGGDINILRPLDSNTDSRFMARLLTYAETFKLARRAQGSTIVHLYGSHLKDIVVFVPSHAEQVEISNAIDLSEQPIQALQAKLQTLKTEKAALMQQLLTGKRRVKLTEVAA